MYQRQQTFFEQLNVQFGTHGLCKLTWSHMLSREKPLAVYNILFDFCSGCYPKFETI